MEKAEGIRRKEQFKRIKDKNEPVYKTPAFLKNALGISSVSESGVFENGRSYTKAYALPEGISLEEIRELCMKVRERNADYGFLTGKGNMHLFVHILKNDMQEALEWFQEEKETAGVSALSLEQRLKYVCQFLAGFLGRECHADRYLTETSAWRMLPGLEGMEMEGAAVKTDAGVFQIMAVRRFPDRTEEGAFFALSQQDAVMASYVEASAVTNQAVSDRLHSEYIGFEGTLSRMKRSSPLVYGVLSEPEEMKEGSFILGQAYFLLGAADAEALEAAQHAFLQRADEGGIQMECIPVSEAKLIREWKKTIAMFGMSGNRSDRYRSILAADGMMHLLPGKASGRNQEEKKYDVEEMKALFFERWK